MLRKFGAILGVILLIVLSAYLLLPNPEFPTAPPNSLQSAEPADTESFYRRSYFTNLSRSEILNHYQDQFKSSSIGFPLVQFLLNYPPEDAQKFIRDQTRSSWLQEIVHPGRESLYVNGFYPTKPTDQINIEGVRYLNKITIRLIPSHPITRLTVLSMSAILFWILIKEYGKN